MVAETNDMSVYARVHAILSELPAIGKNSQAPAAMGGYRFRGIEDITAALKPLLAKHGVVYSPQTLDRIDTERQTANGKALYVVDVHVQFNFFDVHGATFSGSVWGQGSDSGDKAVSKAYTSALKTFLSPTFCISEAENDTERHEVPESTGSRRTSAGRPPQQPADAAPPASSPSSGGAASPDRIKAVSDRAKSLGLGDWVKEQHFTWPWEDDVVDVIEQACDQKAATA